MTFNDPLESGFTHSADFFNRFRQASLHCGSKLIERSGRKQPPVLAGAHQLGNAGNKGAEHRPAKRHRFHDDNRQSFRKRRQNQGTGGQNFVAYAIAADPPCNSHKLSKAVAFDCGFNLSAQWSVAGQDEIHYDALGSQTSHRLDQQKLALGFTQPADANEPLRLRRIGNCRAIKRGFNSAAHNVNLAPLCSLTSKEELAATVRTNGRNERRGTDFLRKTHRRFELFRAMDCQAERGPPEAPRIHPHFGGIGTEMDMQSLCSEFAQPRHETACLRKANQPPDNSAIGSTRYPKSKA